MNEAMRKIIAKNKASKGLHMWNEKAKKQARKQINNCAQGRPKNYANCKIEASKKNATLILLLHSQKNSNSTEKKAQHTQLMHTTPKQQQDKV